MRALGGPGVGRSRRSALSAALQTEDASMSSRGLARQPCGIGLPEHVCRAGWLRPGGPRRPCGLCDCGHPRSDAHAHACGRVTLDGRLSCRCSVMSPPMCGQPATPADAWRITCSRGRVAFAAHPSEPLVRSAPGGTPAPRSWIELRRGGPRDGRECLYVELLRGSRAARTRSRPKMNASAGS
jgi:hypothetical protein